MVKTAHKRQNRKWSRAERIEQSRVQLDSLVVRRYLEALAARKADPNWTPEREHSAAELREQLRGVRAQIRDPATPRAEVMPLMQREMELRGALATEQSQDLEELERLFIIVAKRYGKRMGLSYDAWRTTDIPVSVLRKAGLHYAARSK